MAGMMADGRTRTHAGAGWFLLALIAGAMLVGGVQAAGADDAKSADTAKFVDLSLLVSPELPGTWPAAGFPPFHMNDYLRIGPLSAYNSDILVIDGNTGTQLDVPPHSIPLPDTNCPTPGRSAGCSPTRSPPGSSAARRASSIAATCSSRPPNGRSALVKKERIIAWEKKHRPLGSGDVVLFHSGYSDKYYQAASRRAAASLADPVEGTHAGLARSRSRLHGIPGQPQGDDPGHRQRQHGPAARPGRADAPRRPEIRHDLDRVGHRLRPAADDRRVLLHARPQARRRSVRRRRGRSPSSAIRWPSG